MARGTPYRFRRFARGLNSAVGVYNLREGFSDDPTGLGAEARDVLNVVSSQRGSIRKRYGSTAFFTQAGIKDMNPVDNGVGGALIYSATNGIISARDGSGVTTAIATRDAVAKWKFLRLPDVGSTGMPYYGMNGVDAPLRLSTTAGVAWTATTGNVPNGRFMVYAGNRLWVTGVDGDPTAVFWSEIGDPMTWPVENITRFDSSDGQPITGISTVGPYVLVFKERAVWAIYDLDTSANRKLADQAGTISPYAIVPTEKGTYFLDPSRGVMVTDGQTTKRISEQIQPTLDRISRNDKLATWGAFWKNHLYLGTTLDTTTSRVIDYDTELDSFWLHSTPAQPLCVWDPGGGQQLLGATTAGVSSLYVPDTFADSGAAYTAFWSGPFHDFGQSSLQKRCRRLQMDGRGVVTVYLSTDFVTGQGTAEPGPLDFNEATGTFGGSGTFGGAGVFGGALILGRDELYSLGVGRVWSLTLGDASTLDWEIDDYVFWMDIRKD